MAWQIIRSPILWACLNVIGAGFVANAPATLPLLWVAKWVAAIFAGILMVMLHPPGSEK